MTRRACLFHLFIFCIPSSVIADRLGDCDSSYIQKRCLTGDEPSYFVSVPANSHDQNHIEFYLSLKYPLYWSDQDKVLYFGYAGKYDFYVDALGGRDSSPVISRLQSPSLFYRRNISKKSADRFGVESYRVGLYHESNGQDVEDSTTLTSIRNDVLNSQPRLASEADNIARDFVSRSWNYAGIELKASQAYESILAGNETELDIYLRLRPIYFGVDDNYDFDFMGGRLDPVGVRIEDYNTYSLMVDMKPKKVFTDTLDCEGDMQNLCLLFKDFAGNSRLSVEFTAGRELENLTTRIQLTYHAAGMFPITIFYHAGYLDNLSTYYRQNRYVGIGLEVW